MQSNMYQRDRCGIVHFGEVNCLQASLGVLCRRLQNTHRSPSFATASAGSYRQSCKRKRATACNGGSSSPQGSEGDQGSEPHSLHAENRKPADGDHSEETDSTAAEAPAQHVDWREFRCCTWQLVLCCLTYNLTGN